MLSPRVLIWNHLPSNDRSEPAVEPEGSLKSLFVRRHSVEVDVVRSRFISDRSKAGFVERQNPFEC